MTACNLTAERLRELLHYDPETGVFTNRVRRNQMPAGAISGFIDKGYRRIWIDGATVRAHRVAWLYVYGVLPIEDIDHIDGDKLNNRIANLRDVPRAVNMQNRRVPLPNNASGYLGVSRDQTNKTRPWRARIVVARRIIYLGSFPTPEEAHATYMQAKLIYHAGALVDAAEKP